MHKHIPQENILNPENEISLTFSLEVNKRPPDELVRLDFTTYSVVDDDDSGFDHCYEMPLTEHRHR